jgi:hypothetical protein
MYLHGISNKKPDYLPAYVYNIEKKTNFALRFFSLNDEISLKKCI